MTKAKILRAKYASRHTDHLIMMAAGLEKDMRDNLRTYARIDHVAARAKSVERFCTKARKKEGGKIKYKDPINQIQDQLGVRIVTHYLEDVEKISKIVEKYYSPIERQNVVPDSESKFGYEGKHYVMFVPYSLLPSMDGGNFPKFFELQITTLFQHAWAEAEHDLGYKPNAPLSSEEKRRIAFTAAQAWGADNIFQELHSQFSKKSHKKIGRKGQESGSGTSIRATERKGDRHI